VIVLPWHDPVRVAEQIALLDIMCGGRCLFGFGRGAASTEYEGFRIPMGEARPRFVEAAEIVVKALANETFEHQGQFFQIPRMSIRPRPISNPERRFYASSVSPESAEVIAKLGFGMLMIMQNEWAKCREDIDKFQAMSQAAGFVPKAPIILTNVSCAESREEAQDKAFQYLGRKWQSIDDHYHFSDWPSRRGQRLRGLRQDGQDLRQAQGPRQPQEGDGLLRLDPDRRHARRLPPADRPAARRDGHGPPGHRILVRQPAAS
jgi:Coenzyme F420-dependent N5,N10-methylene tetrahydromethanopterin reductase and related flavin-dependent oxidoreductases